MLMVREFLKNRYRLCCFIGLENSPTCGIHWGRHKVNRYGTESPNPDEQYGKDPKEPVLRGIMAEILEEELGKEGLRHPSLNCRPVTCRFGKEKEILAGSGRRRFTGAQRLMPYQGRL
jgi:hypothetical protein